jgi:hypothetical protein
LNYSLAYPFCNLRNYGVSKCSQSVHPLGNPISHSTHVGFNCPVAPFAWFTESHNEFAGVRPAAFNVSGFLPPFHALLVGVGQYFSASLRFTPPDPLFFFVSRDSGPLFPS